MTADLSTKWRLDQICQVFSIEKSTYYNRLKYLGIEASRDTEGTYLNAEQMKLMEDLNEHIRQTGRMRGFRGGQLAISESSGLASVLEIPEQLESQTFAEVNDEVLDQLIWDAAELKKRQIAEPEVIKLHLAAQMTEDDLPDEMKAELQAVRKLTNPKPNAASIAQQLLQRHRQKQQQKNQELQ
jgi:predicted RND superfamily exporter protein